MDSQMYSKGSYNPTSGSEHSKSVVLLPHTQQNPTISAPTLLQQGSWNPYMYPLPPPPASSASHTPLTTVPVTTQSNAHISSSYPTAQLSSQQEAQSHHRSSHQIPYSSPSQNPPPSTVLPPPPPLPPVTTSQWQASYMPSCSRPSFQQSVSLRNFGPPGVLMPPQLPPSSSLLVPDVAIEKGEVKKHIGEACSGQVLDYEGKDCSKTGPAVADGESAKGISVCYKSLPPEKAESGSPLCANSDTEMEDDITQYDEDLGLNYLSQAPNSGSHMSAVVFSKESTSQQAQAETNSTMGPSRNLQTGLPGYYTLNSYVPLRQESNDDGAKQTSSSPYSGRTNIVPESGSGDEMYDPFLDSIEPLPNASKTSTCVQGHEPASESDIMPKLNIYLNRLPDIEENDKDNDTQVLSGSDSILRLSHPSYKAPDVEENTRGNDIGVSKTEDHEELGDNANGEAGGVSPETDSSHTQDEVTDSNTKVGEDEIAGKGSVEKRTDKEQRSMRHFKVALTLFVKDLLKPSWRQGNMSKQAFKTIMKKSVDKVSSSMEGRRIPKSRAKIDRYIESSQHKLTKLVMGYVNKYVKA